MMARPRRSRPQTSWRPVQVRPPNGARRSRLPEQLDRELLHHLIDVVGGAGHLAPLIADLKAAGILVSLFIEADARAIEVSAGLGADIVELHTGTYCEQALDNNAAGVAREVARLTDGARRAHAAGLEVHAGHGLTYNTVRAIARIPEIMELNIGHFLIGEAIFGGLSPAIARMRALMDAARQPSLEVTR